MSYYLTLVLSSESLTHGIAGMTSALMARGIK